jgi:hypothetical protein
VLVIARLLELAELAPKVSQGRRPPADLIDANSRPGRSRLSRAWQRCAPIKRGSDHIVSGMGSIAKLADQVSSDPK